VLAGMSRGGGWVFPHGWWMVGAGMESELW
jgi:hypothetical protein